jgi:hypothetical protein
MKSNKIKHLHVVCYKWGTKYPADYVNILCAMVRRHLSIPHTFHCITDDSRKLRSDIVVHELPDVGVDGIWRKLMSFQANFLDLQDEFIVSFDLDVVIVDSLDFLGEWPEKTFIIGRNWSRGPDAARASGTLYRLKVGSHSFIWDRFITNPEEAIDTFHGKNRLIGEQNWLNANIAGFDFFPSGKIVSFKRHCRAKGHVLPGKIGERIGFSTAIFGKASVPNAAAVISFHGDPLPPDVMSGRCGRWRHAPFVKEYWHE